MSHFLVNLSTTNIDKVISMLFSQHRWACVDSTFLFNLISICWNNVDKHTSAKLSFSTKFQRWNNVGSSTLNGRNGRCFVNVGRTSINVRRLNFHFQLNINVETTLMNVEDQRWCVCWEIITSNKIPFFYSVKRRWGDKVTWKISAFEIPQTSKMKRFAQTINS